MTSSVGSEPRAFWGGYGASKAAFENLLGAYADETAHAGKLRVQIDRPRRDPHPDAPERLPGRGAASAQDRPKSVAAAIVERLKSDAPTRRAHVRGRGLGSDCSVTCATSIAPPRKPPSQYIR